MTDATEHYNLQKAGAAGTQNQWALNDANADRIERGRTFKGIAGEALSKLHLVHLAEDAATPATPKVLKGTNATRPLMGIALAAAAIWTEVFVQVEGVVEDDAATPTWNWTPGDLLYADGSATPVPGALTATQYGPPVAQALSATKIWLFPGGLVAPS